MAHIFTERKRMMHIILLLMIALLLVCPAAYAQQTPLMTYAPQEGASEYIDSSDETAEAEPDGKAAWQKAENTDSEPSEAESRHTDIIQADIIEGNDAEGRSAQGAEEKETDSAGDDLQQNVLQENVLQKEVLTQQPDEGSAEGNEGESAPTETPPMQTPEPEPTDAADTAAPPPTAAAPTDTPKPEETPVPAPQMRFSRDFSGRYAEYGSYVTLSYTVHNDGELPMTDITVRDGLLGKVGSLECLEPGEKKTFSARVKITQTCTSTPSISYEYADVGHTRYCSEKTIYLADVKIRIEPEADKTRVSPGEAVTLRLRILNNGNVNLYSLRVREPMLGEIGGVVRSLAPGEECVVTRTVQMKSTASFHFEVSGSSDTGSTFSMDTEEISVIVTPAAAEVEMELSARADRTRLDAPGEVCFSLSLNNRCMLELRDVRLSEETRGEIRTLAFVPSGEMPVITHSFRVSESGVYRFMAQVGDAVGDEVTVYSEEIYIAVGSETPQTTESPAAEPTDDVREIIEMPDGSPYRMAEEVATFEKLIVWTVLMLIGVLLMWYIVSSVRQFIRRRRRRKKKRSKNKAAGRRSGGRSR